MRGNHHILHCTQLHTPSPPHSLQNKRQHLTPALPETACNPTILLRTEFDPGPAAAQEQMRTLVGPWCGERMGFSARTILGSYIWACEIVASWIGGFVISCARGLAGS